MTHVLDSDSHSRNGHLPLTPLHTHRQFATTLRMPREHPHHHRAPRPRRRVQAVPVYAADGIGPALLLGCAVVGTAALVVAFEVGRALFGLVRQWIGGS